MSVPVQLGSTLCNELQVKNLYEHIYQCNTYENYHIESLIKIVEDVIYETQTSVLDDTISEI